jgi:hypothetical protein
MRAFILLEEKKTEHWAWGKGVIRVYLHKHTGNILKEHCYQNHHAWADNDSAGSCRLKDLVNDFYKHPKKISK